MSGNEPPVDLDLPGRIKSRFSDNNQLSLYMHWAKMLQAKNWSEIASASKWIASCAIKSKIFTISKPSCSTSASCASGSSFLTDDIRYWMPIRHNTLERPESVSEELSKPGEGYYFDDDIQSLKIRVERVYSKIAWAEMPPSRTRHLITNIRIKKDDGEEIEAHSNFLVYRTRMETDKDIFVGTRQDILRRVGASFKIARRTIILDQAVLTRRISACFYNPCSRNRTFDRAPARLLAGNQASHQNRAIRLTRAFGICNPRRKAR